MFKDCSCFHLYDGLIINNHVWSFLSTQYQVRANIPLLKARSFRPQRVDIWRPPKPDVVLHLQTMSVTSL